jgi:predicted transcriptional regulator
MDNNKNNNLLLISVKPQYAKKIFKGEKTIELRKSAPLRSGKNSYMLIYVTSPVKELWGICKIENIIKENPKVLWKNFGEQTGISKEEFDNYYKDSINAFGIKLKDVKNLLEHSIDLKKLKEIIPGFTPPQTYRYIDINLITNNTFKELLF